MLIVRLGVRQAVELVDQHDRHAVGVVFVILLHARGALALVIGQGGVDVFDSAAPVGYQAAKARVWLLAFSKP